MALPLSYNLRNVRERWRVTVLAVGGIGLVVAVFITLIALYSGFRAALASTGIPENGLFVQRGSQSELTSGIGRDDAEFLSADDRVARNAQGQPLASPELVVAITVPRRDGTDGSAQMRGVSPLAFEVRHGIRMVEGRPLAPGLNELNVGVRVPERFDVALGDTLTIRRREWVVVGVFEAEGSSFESEIWGDLTATQSAFNREGGYQALAVRMADPAALEGWAEDVRRNPRLQVGLWPERKYYEDQAGLVGPALLALALFVAVVMGVGAVFGAMNTMYAIVAQRTREIATLRALGFSRASVLVSFLAESMLIALVGGGLGCALGTLANFLPAAATGNVTFSELAFAFRVTPQAMAIGMAFALVMGLVGGLLPAIRAARLPIARALREA